MSFFAVSLNFLFSSNFFSTFSHTKHRKLLAEKYRSPQLFRETYLPGCAVVMEGKQSGFFPRKFWRKHKALAGIVGGKQTENRWCYHNAIKKKIISLLLPNLSTALEHLEKVLSKANFTVLISCHGDHWTDLKHIQITRTEWTLRINKWSQAHSA